MIYRVVEATSLVSGGANVIMRNKEKKIVTDRTKHIQSIG